MVGHHNHRVEEGIALPIVVPTMLKNEIARVRPQNKRLADQLPKRHKDYPCQSF